MFDEDRYNELLGKVPDLGFRELIDIRHAIKSLLETVTDDGAREILTEASDAANWLGDNLYDWASSRIENPDLERTDTEADQLVSAAIEVRPRCGHRRESDRTGAGAAE